MNGDMSALRAWITLAMAHMRSREGCGVEDGADRGPLGPDDQGQGTLGEVNGWIGKGTMETWRRRNVIGSEG